MGPCAGKQYTCSVQIEVRAPGLRAEGCWSTEGQGDDVDLHMAKINGFHAVRDDRTRGAIKKLVLTRTTTL